MPKPEILLARARAIDPDRATSLEHELGASRPLAVLLGTAFPPLRPRLGWQVDALDELWRSGWRSRRNLADLLPALLARVGDLSDSERVGSELRRAVWIEKARIALRELMPTSLGGAAIDVTAGELADLAEAALEVALAEARSHVSARFGEPLLDNGSRSGLVTLGMGKLGGHELNAGSDIDLIFIYDSDEGAAGEINLHDYWTRVVRRAVATIDTPSADGLVWRVDLRLRPEGSQGPVVNSLAAAERYYETWGRLWERAALLKSRAIAGSGELGAEIDRGLVKPFVFRREVDPSIATSMSEMLLRARATSSDPDRDVKLGSGGIREAEFFVQSLQLIWGGRESSLHVQGTLRALSRLRSRGFVTDREARAIAYAYRLLRRVEHANQWMTGLQTHLVPSDRHELDLLARILEHSDGPALLSELDSVRERVAGLFASLSPSEPRLSRYHGLLRALGDPEADLGEWAERLGGMEVLEHLRAFTKRPDHLFGSLTRERHPSLADELLDAIAESPDPEQSARTLRALLGRFDTPGPWISTLAQDMRALHRFLWVIGASAFVADAVIAGPELATVVLFGKDAAPEPRRVIADELQRAKARAIDDSDPYAARESFVGALRRAKRLVMVEVAVADLAGVIATREATRILSDLADETLERAVGHELGESGRGLALIAVGKLGGREIGYGSDLDVLFIFDPEQAPPDKDPGEHFVRVAQRIIRLISEPHPAGPGYELDTRLRPSGSHGMLVTSLASFARYHGLTSGQGPDSGGPAVQSSGAAWERQALIRARGCAGDAALLERAMEVANTAAYEQGAPPVEEMHRLRLRMQAELGREHDARYDLKTGYGGLLDIEFATQWLQMRYGRDPRIRTPDTAQALEALVTAGYLGRSDYETFREAYTFLRRLEQRIHVLHASSSTVIDARAPGMAKLARRLGMHDSAQSSAVEELFARYRDVTRAVRSAYLTVLGISAGEGGPPRSRRT